MGNLIDLPRWHGPLSTFVPGQSVFPLLLPIPQPRIKCGIVNSQAPILPHFDLYLCNESYWDSSPSRHSYKRTIWVELKHKLWLILRLMMTLSFVIWFEIFTYIRNIMVRSVIICHVPTPVHVDVVNMS